MEWEVWATIILIIITFCVVFTAMKCWFIEAKLDKLLNREKLTAKTLVRIQRDLKELLEKKDED